MDDDLRMAVERWLLKAEHDIEAARRSLEKEPILTDMACFHSQQCAEKSLKAFLVFQSCQVEKTHDLGKLVEACGKLDNSFLEMHPLLKGMSAYAITERYADDWREILLPEATDAVEKAEKVLGFVRGKI